MNAVWVNPVRTRHFSLLLAIAFGTGCSSIASRTKPREAKVYPGVRNLENYGGGVYGEGGGYFAAADFVASAGLDTLLFPFDLTYKPAPLAPEPPPAPVARFKGTYVFGREQSEFRPEGSREKWWVTGSIDDLRKKFVSSSKGARQEFTGPVVVVVDGELSAEGEHGHLGIYERELRVTQVVEVGPMTAEKKK